jgi:diadenosine tetraphosphate (Ap4A) HIT family hydrolase
MNCIFCRRDGSIITETTLSFAVFDNFPVSKGHALVIPKRHVVTVWELSTEEYADVFDLVRQVKEIIQEKFDPQGINVNVNCGEAAEQTVFHAHIHVNTIYRRCSWSTTGLWKSNITFGKVSTQRKTR